MNFHWHCPACNHDERAAKDLAVMRLRTIGRLKRGDKVETAMLLEIARMSASLLHCVACGSSGIELREGEPSRDDFGEKRCDSCGAAIDPERLEVFPETTQCTACQRNEDRGRSTTEVEYCRTCGSPLQMAKSSAGVTRYQMICPHCRRG